LLAHTSDAEKVCTRARELTVQSLGRNSAALGDVDTAVFEGAVLREDWSAAKRAYGAANQLFGNEVVNRMRRGRLQSALAQWYIVQKKWSGAREILPTAIADVATRSHRLPLLLAQARLLYACSQQTGPQCSAELRKSYEQTYALMAPLRHPQTLSAEILIAQIDGEKTPVPARARLQRAIDDAARELESKHPLLAESRAVMARLVMPSLP
jgi:hypothetical protein